jgi:hypothetical protein
MSAIFSQWGRAYELFCESEYPTTSGIRSTRCGYAGCIPEHPAGTKDSSRKGSGIIFAICIAIFERIYFIVGELAR